MSTSRKRRKKETKVEEVSQTESTPAQPPVLSPEEQEIRDLMSQLLTKSQELAFELATEENEAVLRSPLAQKAREIVIVVKKLFEVMRRRITGTSTSQTTM